MSKWLLLLNRTDFWFSDNKGINRNRYSLKEVWTVVTFQKSNPTFLSPHFSLNWNTCAVESWQFASPYLWLLSFPGEDQPVSSWEYCQIPHPGSAQPKVQEVVCPGPRLLHQPKHASWTQCESLSTHMVLQPQFFLPAGKKTFHTSIPASKPVLNLESSRSSRYKQLQALPINSCPSDTKAKEQVETNMWKVKTLALPREDRGSGGALQKALVPQKESTPEWPVKVIKNTDR